MLSSIRFTLSFYVFLLLAISSVAQPFYGHTIHASHRTNYLLSATIRDLQYHLQKVSQDSIRIDTRDTTWQHGICLIKLDKGHPSEFDHRLDPHNSDAFVLRSDGSGYMHIIAYTEDGLTNGMYTYMDLLGFRWFHPGNVWTYIPPIKDIRLRIDSAFTPDFVLRSFFGSYGTPRNPVIDKPKSVQNEWFLWSTRNRMGGSYILHGHEWNSFLWANIDTLKQHPEYMALVKGSRVVPTTAAKFCLSNKNLRELFVEYMVAKLKKDMAANPGQERYLESVEPSDGGGSCKCDNCKKMGSFSTQVFTLANEAARALRKVSPNAGVNLLAYYAHADTPNVKLEHNVLVQIVPYKYQKVTSADSLIDMWCVKKDTLFMYDYFGLPILNLDMPLHKPIEYVKRVKYWHTHKVKGMVLESSYSIGAAGLGLYLFSRLGWDVHASVHDMADEYYRLNYGKAAQAMYQAQAVLADTLERRKELYSAVRTIHDKIKMSALTHEQQQRIVAYESYLHYLKLLYEYKTFDKANEPQTTDSLIRYANSIFMRMMTTNFPLIEYMWAYGPTKDYVHKYWDIYHPGDGESKYPSVQQCTDEQIQRYFEEDYREMKKELPYKNLVEPNIPDDDDE